MLRYNHRWLVVLAVLPLVAGCVQSKLVVHVNKDGSGRVVHTTYTKTLDLGIPGLQTGGPIPGAENGIPGALNGIPHEPDQAKAEAAAKEMGEGVTVESVKTLPMRGEWKGTEVVYAFADVSKIQLDPMPGAETNSAPGAGLGDAAASSAEREKIKFEFEPPSAGSSIAKMKMKMPPMSPADAGGDEGGPPEMMAGLFQQFFQDAKIEMAVQVDGVIVATNAKFVSKSNKAVGVVRMNLGDLVNDPAALKAMLAMQSDKDRESIAKKLSSKPLSKHLQVETQEVVNIDF